MAEYCSTAYMYYTFFIHLSVSGHLGYFHALAFVNSAAMNIGVHVSLQNRFSPEINAQGWDCRIIW